VVSNENLFLICLHLNLCNTFSDAAVYRIFTLGDDTDIHLILVESNFYG
jgi:hypothetical protein